MRGQITQVWKRRILQIQITPGNYSYQHFGTQTTYLVMSRIAKKLYLSMSRIVKIKHQQIINSHFHLIYSNLAFNFVRPSQLRPSQLRRVFPWHFNKQRHMCYPGVHMEQMLFNISQIFCFIISKSQLCLAMQQVHETMLCFIEAIPRHNRGLHIILY